MSNLGMVDLFELLGVKTPFGILQRRITLLLIEHSSEANSKQPQATSDEDASPDIEIEIKRMSPYTADTSHNPKNPNQ